MVQPDPGYERYVGRPILQRGRQRIWRTLLAGKYGFWEEEWVNEHYFQ